MGSKPYITGMKEVLRNVEKANQNASFGIERGLKLGSIVLQGESQKQVPIDLSNLRGSAFHLKTSGSGFSSVYTVGYTAEYAASVHEMPMKNKGKPRTGYHIDGEKKKGEWWGGNDGRGKNKFLEDPMKDDLVRGKIKDKIKQSIKFKL